MVVHHQKMGWEPYKPMTNEGEVYFRLYGGDFDPDPVSAEIGLQATSARRKGVPIPKSSSWMFSSGKVEGEVIDVYAMASTVVAALRPHTESIRSVKERLGLEAVLQVVLTVSSDERISTPAIGFESDVIAFLHDVGAYIDVDTYKG